MKLEDDEIVGDYGLEKGLIIDLFELMQIFIKTRAGKQISVDVSGGD
jgi:hypothetical protein